MQSPAIRGGQVSRAGFAGRIDAPPRQPVGGGAVPRIVATPREIGEHDEEATRAWDTMVPAVRADETPPDVWASAVRPRPAPTTPPPVGGPVAPTRFPLAKGTGDGFLHRLLPRDRYTQIFGLGGFEDAGEESDDATAGEVPGAVARGRQPSPRFAAGSPGHQGPHPAFDWMARDPATVGARDPRPLPIPSPSTRAGGAQPEEPMPEPRPPFARQRTALGATTVGQARPPRTPVRKSGSDPSDLPPPPGGFIKPPEHIPELDEAVSPPRKPLPPRRLLRGPRNSLREEAAHEDPMPAPPPARDDPTDDADAPGPSGKPPGPPRPLGAPSHWIRPVRAATDVVSGAAGAVGQDAVLAPMINATRAIPEAGAGAALGRARSGREQRAAMKALYVAAPPRLFIDFSMTRRRRSAR